MNPAATNGTLDNAGNGSNPEPKRKSMAGKLYGSSTNGPSNKPPTIVTLGKPATPSNAGAVPNGRVVTKGAVPVKTGAVSPGNQGTKNSHTRPSAIKPVGTAAQMRKFGSVTSTSALQKVGGNKLGDKKGASNAARVLYPSMRSDTSRKL